VPVEEVYIPLEYKDAVQCANAVVMIQEADHETAAVMLEFQRNTYCYGDDLRRTRNPRPRDAGGTSASATALSSLSHAREMIAFLPSK